MPTVLRIDGLRVIIYVSDHRPAHVHVKSAGKEALFYLNCPTGPPKLRVNFGMSPTELNRIEKKLAPYIAALCATWRDMHDAY